MLKKNKKHLETVYACQFTLSTQLIKPNYLVILPSTSTQHLSFFRSSPLLYYKHSLCPFSQSARFWVWGGEEGLAKDEPFTFSQQRRGIEACPAGLVLSKKKTGRAKFPPSECSLMMTEVWRELWTGQFEKLNYFWPWRKLFQINLSKFWTSTRMQWNVSFSV